MIQRLRVFGDVLVALAAVFLLGNGLFAQEIKIEIEDGIPVVYNPKEPVALPNTPSHLTLIEDLRLGEPDENQNYPFSELSWYAVDADENMIIMDNKEVCIKVFDRTGKFLRKFGHKGQGPGELQSVSFMGIIEGDEIGVVDPPNHRYYHFSRDGECLKQIDLGAYWRVERVKPDHRGFLYANFYKINRLENEVSFDTELIKFDPDFKPVMTLASFEQTRKRNEVDMLEKRFGYDIRGDGVVVWGINTEYVLNFVNPDGQLIRKVVKDYGPVKLTDKDREMNYKLQFGDRVLPPEIKLNYPKNYYPFNYVMCDDEGRTYVRSNSQDAQGEFYFDVFDSEGRYFARFSRPWGEMPSIVKKGKMYSIMLDRNELPLLRRYKMVWK
jgi:hypothetical protein